MIWKTRKPLQHNAFPAPFAGLAEPPTADYRGVRTCVCPCGCDMLVIVARFDEETRLPGFYLLDARCASCGSWLTAPTPVDDAHG
jgi:hypothetical protein